MVKKKKQQVEDPQVPLLVQAAPTASIVFEKGDAVFSVTAASAEECLELLRHVVVLKEVRQHLGEPQFQEEEE